jgi:rhodanese-related sulfurtransferase
MAPHFARLAKEVYGYKNVKYMVEGHMTWQAGISPYYTTPEFLKMAREEGLSHILVDVRSSEKARAAHIEGAVNYPLSMMKELDKALPGNQKSLARIIYYSDDMEEAIQAHRIMRTNGWENGYILSGGLEGWKAKGYPLQKDKLQTEIAFNWTPLPGAMFINEYEELVRNLPDDTIIVDNRSPAEYMRSMVPGALTMPIDTMDARWSELPRDKKIVIQCQAGNRALMGYRILKNNGFENVRWVDGHINQFSADILQAGAYQKQILQAKGATAR